MLSSRSSRSTAYVRTLSTSPAQANHQQMFSQVCVRKCNLHAAASWLTVRHLDLTLPSYPIPSRDTNQIFKTKNGEEKKKTRIIILLTRSTSFHVYVLERYDICMVRCDAQREWHVTGSALSWSIVLSRCDVITVMLWQSFTVEVVLKVISVVTPAIRHIHVKMFYNIQLGAGSLPWPSLLATVIMTMCRTKLQGPRKLFYKQVLSAFRPVTLPGN